ncbi:MAG: heme exporter protein CcmD [Halorhodospira sp.]
MWDGIGDFLAMGGYALYVWGAFGMVALGLLLEGLLVARRRRQVRARLQRQSRRPAAARNQGE